MNLRRSLSLWLALLAWLGAGRASGQSLGLSQATLVFPNAGVAQLNAGWVEHAGIQVRIDASGSTTSWTLTLRDADGARSAGGKDPADLQWRTGGATAWTPMTTTDQAISSGSGNAEVTVFFRTRVGWAADRPGDYGASLVFTLGTV
jgi:hypothetical protein